MAGIERLRWTAPLNKAELGQGNRGEQMSARTRPLIRLLAIATGLTFASLGTAQHARDTSMPMQSILDYDKSRLVGNWYEVARSKSRIEQDCHGVTADVETREDTRFTLKIECHKGSVSGPILNIDSILVEVAPSVFELRFVRFRAFGHQTLIVLWQAEDDSAAAVGSLSGEFGWIWSKTATIAPETLELAREKLVEAGYRRQGIRPVQHGQ